MRGQRPAKLVNAEVSGGYWVRSSSCEGFLRPALSPVTTRASVDTSGATPRKHRSAGHSVSYLRGLHCPMVKVARPLTSAVASTRADGEVWRTAWSASYSLLRCPHVPAASHRLKTSPWPSSVSSVHTMLSGSTLRDPARGSRRVTSVLPGVPRSIGRGDARHAPFGDEGPKIVVGAFRCASPHVTRPTTTSTGSVGTRSLSRVLHGVGQGGNSRGPGVLEAGR